MQFLIGKIINTHGLKGMVTVRSLTDFNRFLKDEEVYVIYENNKITLKIKEAKEANKGLLVSFYDYDDINKIEMYKGLNIYTDQRPSLEEDEYHYSDLLEKEVYNQNDKFIGKVIDVIEAPQGHLLRVQTDTKKVLIPFNDNFVINVDKVITIQEIEGLI